MSTVPPARPKFESTLFTDRDAARTIARTRKPYFELAAFILTGVCLAVMLILWTIALVDRPLLFVMYPVPVIAVWRIVPICVVLAVALGWGRAQKAIIVSRCVLAATAALIYLYTLQFGSILPLRQVLTHGLGAVCLRASTGTTIGGLRGRDAFASAVDFTDMTAANKPSEPPDYMVGVFLDRSVSPFTTTISAVAQQTPVYPCPYYSAENVIGNPGANEYMQAPQSFKTWFQNALANPPSPPPGDAGQ